MKILLLILILSSGVWGTTSPIRITLDFSSISIEDATLLQQIKDLVMNSQGFFQRRLSIYQPFSAGSNNIITTSNGKCGDTAIPPADSTTGTIHRKILGIANSDIHFYIGAVTASDPQSAWMAQASFCMFDITKKRPVAAKLTYNLAFLNSTSLTEDYKLWMDTTIHEMLHALAFDSRVYSNFLRKSTGQSYGASASSVVQLRSLDTTILKTELLVELVQKFYDCPTAIGIQLENQGTGGSVASHFERTILYDDIMTASRIGFSKGFTLFAFTFLQDTGWYDVDMRFADGQPFGYKQGCSFLESACKDTAYTSQPNEGIVDLEFCSQLNYPGCTPDYSSNGLCTNSDPFADVLNILHMFQSCSYFQWIGNQMCTVEAHSQNDQNFQGSNQIYGWNSKCFESSLGGKSVTQCYQYTCNEDDESLTVDYGTQKIECKTSGETKTLTDVEGKFTCPDLDKFCKQERKYCPGWCSMKGHCTGGVCTCRMGYAGVDCSKQCDAGKYYNDASTTCASSCPDGTYSNSLNSNCDKCKTSCSTCTAIDNCQTCAANYLLKAAKCVTSCGQTYFVDSSNICQQCDNNCLTCTTSANECTSCANDKFLENKVCVTTCSSGYYKYAPDKTCVTSCPQYKVISGNECVACSALTFYENDACVGQCLDGFYGKLEGQYCATCDPACLTCDGPTSIECLSCPVDKYQLNSECFSTCPDGSYQDTDQKKCLLCPTTCTACTSSTTCTKCNPDYYLQVSLCVSKCDAGSFTDIVAGSCTACHSTCLTCDGDTIDDCVTCQNKSYSLLTIGGLKCFTQCPDGYYNGSKTCLQCNSACTKCSGPKANQCSQCKVLKAGSTCYHQCPLKGFYKAGTNCKVCDASCEQCVGPLKTDCTKCKAKTFLVAKDGKGSCNKECPKDTTLNIFLDECIWAQNLIAWISIIILLNI